MDLVAGRTFAQERRPVRHVDWFLIVLACALSAVGLLLLYSATSQTLRQDGLDPFTRVNKQAFTIGLGIVVVIVMMSFDYRFLKIYSGFIYLGSILALVLVRIPGLGATDSTGTAQRWFEIAGFQITPSEFTKLALIVMLGAVLAGVRTSEPTLADVGKVLLISTVPLALVFLQPDIGTSISIVAIVVGMLIVAGPACAISWSSPWSASSRSRSSSSPGRSRTSNENGSRCSWIRPACLPTFGTTWTNR